MKTPPLAAPKMKEMPARRERTALGDAGEPLCEIKVKLETSTTVMGGSTRTRVVDDAEIIRAASVRGALRFWWRALHGHNFKTARELFDAEAALWGRAAEKDGGVGRSCVEVRILDAKATEKETHNIVLYDGKDGKRDPHAYALFAARGQTSGKTEEQRNPAERYKPGITFELLLRVPEGREQELRRTVKAWILFGGYGARTRRGVGSLTVRAEHRDQWLPTACTASALNEHLGMKLFGVAGGGRRDTASLLGARLFTRSDKPIDDAMRAWEVAINWLSDFRHKPGEGGDFARGAVSNKRPGRSRWPEADKVRVLTRRHAGRHAPLHNAKPVWPRAGFGLPIVGQFIDKGEGDPGNYTIVWYDRHGTKKDRLSSPLILKAMPLANGKYVPAALWFHRAFPEGGQAGLDDRNPGLAPMDRLVAEGDEARYSPLAGITGHDQLQQAFFKWLDSNNYASEVR